MAQNEFVSGGVKDQRMSDTYHSHTSVGHSHTVDDGKHTHTIDFASGVRLKQQQAPLRIHHQKLAILKNIQF